jgi:hypothetical protein
VRSAGSFRWAISLADLVLLLLGFSMMLHVVAARQRAPVGHAAAAIALPTANVVLDERAASLFEDGEARLTPHARARLSEVGRAALARRHIEVQSSGLAPGGARFDRWELTAARAAAVARALSDAGIAQDRIDLSIPPTPGKPAAEQRIAIRLF